MPKLPALAMRCFTALLALAVVLLGLPSASAQTSSGRAATRIVPAIRPLTRISGQEPIIADFELTPVEGLVESQDPEGDEPEDEEEKGPESDRSKKLKKLTFDRRPSTALKAWAQPPEKDEVEEEAEVEEEVEEVMPEIEPVEVDTEGMTEEEAEEALEDAEKEAEKARKDAEKKAKKARDAAEKKAKKEAEKLAKERAKEELERELALFQRRVTLGKWPEVREYLASLPRVEGRAAYIQLIESLAKGPERINGSLAEFAEKNYFDADDLVGLIDAAPRGFKPKQITELGKLLRQSVDEGCLIEKCLGALRPALERETFPLERDELAHILLEGSFPVEAGEFLPSLEQAQSTDDRPVLNLIARHHLARYQREREGEDLDAAWKATMSALAEGEVEDKIKEEALKRAVQLAPDVHATRGQAWLTESFTTRPERGMEILALIGASASRALFEQAKLMPARKTSLELQTTAAEALLEANHERAQEWSDALNLLANNWLQEAACTYRFDTSTTRGQRMQVDQFGNVYYYNTGFNQMNRNMPVPISTDDMLAMRPSERWMELIADGLRPKFEMVTAQLLLKVKAEEEAFPYIERLALTHPEHAEDLVEEFLRVWTKNHNPNVSNNRTNDYMFIYGFSQRSAGIPLTRSKQERNLEQLSEWVRRIRALPLEHVNEELVASAFAKAHSTAEVYRLETIERVFGALNDLEPRTVAALVQHMRQNLVGVWRQPATQEKSKTNRRQKDIEQEILRGYQAATDVAQLSLSTHPDDWSLRMALASVAHDENNFRQEVEKSSEFAPKRTKALRGFFEAAQLYADALPGLKEDEESTNLYETWFYASLGACDLQALDSYKQPMRHQFALIKDAIETLPAEAAQRHMDRFANALFTRIGSVNPAVKYSYLQSGLEIAGDTERTREAHEILTYYKDLTTEIRLEVEVDGSDHVGSGEPFGLYVNLLHTGAIERESGGFGKYLVNQNATTRGFNYGRPTEDYRDKFEEFTRDVLSEHFEVRSITFNQPDTHSRATAEYGWRITPYAYVLLEARGPEVDRVPSLRLDLDFLDSVGYALLPIESSAVPIDCGSGTVDPRPFEQLKLTQTLDERQASEGKLILEIQASARGLLPELEDLVDLAPEGFEIVETDDQGVSVSKFDAESASALVITDRTWTVEMQANANLKELPESFTFATTLLPADEVELTYQRYLDADLASVGPKLDLDASYGEVDGPGFLTWFFGLAALAAVIFGARSVLASRRAGPAPSRFAVPDPLSPFTVIGLLRRIESTNGLSPTSRGELVGQIDSLEEHYFGDAVAEPPDLATIARTWVQRAT